MLRISAAATCALLLIAAVARPSQAAAVPQARVLEEVVVVAPYGAQLARDRVAGNIQTADAGQIQRAQPLDLTDFLNRHFSSVHISHAQNNPLQPDINFRGFTASPLLGLPQGLAVYQNGARINETFGDTVNWDLIALSAIDSAQLLAGSNPLFGLNSLGGALTLQMKNGFNYQGAAVEAYGGSFARRAASIQQGENNGRWGYYVNADYFAEDGWRDYSASDATRLFGALSFRGAASSADVSVAHAQSKLRGNGAAPIELLEIDRAQVFTHPDLTENSFTQVIAEGSMNPSSTLRISGNAFYRKLDTDTFNGDGTIFEECEFVDGEYLVEEDFTDLNDDGECHSADDADIALVLDQSGNRIEAEIDGQELNAVNNIGRREQESFGASAQMVLQSRFGERRNDFTFGIALSRGDTSFASQVEVARLLDDRSTLGAGLFADEFRTAVDSRVSTSSVYFADTLDVARNVAVTVSGRYDSTRVELLDRSGQSPELNGRHTFARFNPALGATYRIAPSLLIYATLSESARAPTPVELACADQDAPCSLPNAFLADPPLDEVVAQSMELGVRGALRGVRWHLGAFHTINRDDILFQTTGGAQANVGFFDNVSDTRRAGIEFSLSQSVDRLDWFLQYSFIDATFEDDFVVSSPNHPALDGGSGKLLVVSGSTIPGIPQHQANIGADYSFGERFSLGGDLSFRSGVYLRGDEANALEQTGSYAVVNLRGEYRVGDAVVVFARVENVFDTEYETFGLLGEPDEVFADFEDPRFLGAGPPFGAWLGVRIRW